MNDAWCYVLYVHHSCSYVNYITLYVKYNICFDTTLNLQWNCYLCNNTLRLWLFWLCCIFHVCLMKCMWVNLALYWQIQPSRSWKKMLLMQLKETKLSLQVAIQILSGGLNDQPVDALLSLQVLHASCYIFCHFDQHLRC